MRGEKRLFFDHKNLNVCPYPVCAGLPNRTEAYTLRFEPDMNFFSTGRRTGVFPFFKDEGTLPRKVREISIGFGCLKFTGTGFERFWTTPRNSRISQRGITIRGKFAQGFKVPVVVVFPEHGKS